MAAVRPTLLALGLALAACGGRAAPTPAPTTDQQIAAASEAALECLGNAGVACVSASPASDAWMALDALTALDRLPPAAALGPLYRGADALRGAGGGLRAVTGEVERIVAVSRGHACQVLGIDDARLAARRAGLVARARSLGLDRTPLGDGVQALSTAAAQLDAAKLVRARCADTALWLLVVPPRTDVPADEDPRAYGGGGWQIVVASDDQRRLVFAPDPAAPELAADRPAQADAVHPWIPVSELEL
jgi:hypothetical protein